MVAGGGIDYISESGIINTLVCREILDNYDGLFFHSSALMLDGKAYLFSAPSGTGKSTHTALWQRHFGGRVQMINDDKPIIRKKAEFLCLRNSVDGQVKYRSKYFCAARSGVPA